MIRFDTVLAFGFFDTVETNQLSIFPTAIRCFPNRGGEKHSRWMSWLLR